MNHDTNKILLRLSEQQREAVTYTQGPLLILAGAGSGKTRVLTNKVAWLISEGISRPENILAVTFTNKAAGEMRTRIDKLIGDEYSAKKIQVSTFHGYGLRFLFRHREAAKKILDLREGFVVFDRDSSRSLVKEILDETKTPEDREPSEMVDIISRDYVTWSPLPYQRFIKDEWMMDIADQYRSRLRKLNAVDFDDLMILPLMIMEQDSAVRNHERERIKWLLVDEYQDVNNAQALLLRRYLVGKNCIINAVGDPDQSIYGWRGANIDVILNFTGEYPKAKIIRLEQNYRSTKIILDASNALIRRNIHRLKKELFTANSTGEKIHTMTAADDFQEADFIVREVSRLHELKNYRYSNIAVLYRQNSMSRLLEKTFLKEKIPCRIIRGVSFYERMEVKDVLAILKLAVNPADTISMERAAKIKVLLEGMGAKTLGRWSDWITEEAAGSEFFGMTHSPSEIWESVAAGEWKVKGKAGESMKNFASHMRVLSDLADKGAGECVDYVLEDMGYLGYLASYDRETFDDRLSNVKELKSIVPGGNLREALAEAALFTDADTADYDSDAVGLMTLHAAKGLEFPIVFIAGMENGIFPHTIREDCENPVEDMEEERRLCYVGMTRAEKKLYLTSAVRRMMYGGLQENEQSIFISEIPDELKRIDDRSSMRSFYDRRDSQRRNYGGYSSNGRYRSW